MNKAYVQQYAKLEKEHWWFIVRSKIILNALKQSNLAPPLHILNIGAAGGESSNWLSAWGTVVSLETEAAFIEHLQSENFNVVNASITNMPFENETFDLVCAFDVIEHVEDDLAATQEIARVCKKGGSICITVPAFKILWGQHDVVNNHLRRYTKKSLLALCKELSQIENTRMRYFNSLLFIPILIVRKITEYLLKSKAGNESDFRLFRRNRIMNQIFKTIFSIESILPEWMSFPVGVSLLSIWKKKENSRL